MHAFINNLERSIGTYLLRPPDVRNDGLLGNRHRWIRGDTPYAEIWRSAEKVVYSRNLHAVTSARTRIWRTFEPDAIQQLVESSSATNLGIGGANLRPPKPSTPASSTNSTSSWPPPS